MKLYIKQKVFSFKDKFNIYDESGESRYYVEGEVFSLGKKLHVFDNNGNEIAFIKQKVPSLLMKFFIERKDSTMNVNALVEKQFSLKPSYRINEFGWNVTGDFFAHNYVIEGPNGTVATITKKWMSWGDSYEIDIASGQDNVNVLCVVLVIDACLAAEAATANSSS